MNRRQHLIEKWKAARNPEKGKPTGQVGTVIKCFNTHYADENRWTVAVRYHGTNIVTYDGEGNVSLNHGGWMTQTTKARINQYAPHGIQVFQKDFEWYVRDTRNVPKTYPFGGSSNYNYQTVRHLVCNRDCCKPDACEA